jgi:uncharacterized protein (TIGR02231 family)
MFTRKWGDLLLAVTAALCASAASAEDVDATSAIASVLVFPNSAEVTRLGEIRLPAGEHRVTFRGLPQTLDADSLRVRFGDEAVIVGAVEAQGAYAAGGGPEQAQALRDRLLDLQDQMQAVDDRIATAELQLQFLQNQAGAAPKTDGSGGLDPEAWAAALASIGSGGQEARERILEARQERRALERAIAEVQLELNSWQGDRALRNDVTVALTAERALTTELELQYQVVNAGWGALYEARLDSEAASLTLDRKIRVFQSSGEDWLRVRLSVSTAPPSYQMEAPYVGSQYLTLMDPAPPADRRGYAQSPAPAREESFAASPRADLDEMLNSLPQFEPNSRTQAIDTVDASFASTYAVGGLVDVPSDGVPRTFTIGQEDIDVALVIRTAPRWSPEAFLTAKITYGGDGPLPPGDLRLYRDGAYLTASYWDTVIPGEEIELGFGIDQSVIVTRVDEGGKESETGLIGRNKQLVADHRFTALNRHRTPFTVEIIDTRPIAQDDDIVVRIDPGSTAPDETQFEDAPGVVVWRRELAPDATLEVRNAYTVTYPGNRILVGQ